MKGATENELRSWLLQLAAGGGARSSALEHLDKACNAYVRGYWMWAFRLPRRQAEDLWQDLLLKLWEARAGYSGAGSATGWLMKLVRNAALDVVASTAFIDQAALERRHAANDNGADGDAPEPEVTPWIVGGEDSNSELQDCLYAAFLELRKTHPQHAEALMAKYIADLSISELAEHIGRTEIATKAFLVIARARVEPLLLPCLELRP